MPANSRARAHAMGRSFGQAALKHGLYARDALAERRRQDLLRQSRKLLRDIG